MRGLSAAGLVGASLTFALDRWLRADLMTLASLLDKEEADPATG